MICISTSYETFFWEYFSFQYVFSDVLSRCTQKYMQVFRYCSLFFFLILSKPEMQQQILKQTSVVETYASMFPCPNCCHINIDKHKGTDRQGEDNSSISAGFVYENAKCMTPFNSTSSANDVSNSSIVKFVTASSNKLSFCSYNQIPNQIKDEGWHLPYRTQFYWRQLEFPFWFRLCLRLNYKFLFCGN